MLIVNGINTTKKGSGFNLLSYWLDSFNKNNISYTIFNTIPSFKYQNIGLLYNLYLIIYFMPGALVRVLKFPFFEFFYKISFIQVIKFLKKIRLNDPQQILLSHHSTFYLLFFCRKRKINLIVHDLIYLRALSLGYSKKISRLLLKFEIFLYARADCVLCVSYQEQRILNFLGLKNVEKISCIQDKNIKLNVSTTSLKINCKQVAVISDWRRPENIHGLKLFLKKSFEKKPSHNTTIILNIYGFGCENLTNHLKRYNKNNNLLKINIKGYYDSISRLDESIVLVPIFFGAGIKIKVLEILLHDKVVVGTKNAFLGLPPWIINKICFKINTVWDLQEKNFIVSKNDFFDFNENYKKYFIDIGVFFKSIKLN